MTELDYMKATEQHAGNIKSSEMRFVYRILRATRYAIEIEGVSWDDATKNIEEADLVLKSFKDKTKTK